MSHRHWTAAALGFVLLLPVHAAHAATTPAKGRDCFLSRDWGGWSAPGSSDFILIHVGVRDYYRIDVTPGTHVHRWPDEFLVNRLRGSSWICSPLDLDLEVRDHSGFTQTLIARSIHKLTPAEVAAIPKKDLP